MLEKLLDVLFNGSIVEPKNITEYTEIFKLPIEYLDDGSRHILSENIITDLELLNCEDKKSLYSNIFTPTSLFGITNLNLWCKYYTTDRIFLKDPRVLLEKFSDVKFANTELESKEISSENLAVVNTVDDTTIYELCNDIIEDDGFLERYHYLDLPLFKDLNKNETVLQCLAYQNLSSPIFALMIPIISLLLPFFIIKLQGHKITWDLYIEHLKKVFGNHVLGQLLSNFMDYPIEKKIYLAGSLFFYGFQIYNNINTCITYYANIKYIHETLNTIKIYLENTLTKIDNLLIYSLEFTSYSKFNTATSEYKAIIVDYLDNLYKIKEYKFDIKTVLQLGHLMKCFYIINNDNTLIDAIKYTFGFNGYIDNLNHLQDQLKRKNMNFCTFMDEVETKKSKKSKKSMVIKNNYFAGLNDKNPVKNDVKLANNMIITGPNAAGKTTVLKSILFNIILSQQIGCGFYDKADIKLFNYIHCYINIPDTGDRDSLFQAECRKCKDILQIIMDNPDKNHLCVFDELYSGTNPYEAIASGYGYLDHVSKLDNVNFVLTTHYVDLCKRLENKVNKNHYMDIKINEEIDGKEGTSYDYTYKLLKGISEIKGGIKVLKDLEYPDEIINNMQNSLKNINIS